MGFWSNPYVQYLFQALPGGCGTTGDHLGVPSLDTMFIDEQFLVSDPVIVGDFPSVSEKSWWKMWKKDDLEIDVPRISVT